MITCGIDEAGYGPKLGPLVIGLSVFKHLGDIESFLAGLPVRIDDSKKIYNPSKGIKELEKSVLSFIDSDDIKKTLSFYDTPFPITKLPLVAEYGQLKTNLVEKLLKKNRIKPYFKTIVINPVDFNQFVTNNSKSSLVFELFCKLIKDTISNHQSDHILFQCGKLSFRKYYKEGLENYLQLRFNAVKETHEESKYINEKARVTIQFLLDAEDKSKAVALSSMIAKYLRELYMRDFNSNWAETFSIKPTSGYGADADRFIRELRKKTPADCNQLIRIK
ncbi:MAG: hypothetical protein HY606_04500 [Planctomycetes bacterium]|nr:hypothetical protein [Planctomycetota bacterium]